MINAPKRFYLHPFVRHVRIVMTHEHNFIMMSEIAVWNGNGGGPQNSVNQAIRTVGERTMIYP